MLRWLFRHLFISALLVIGVSAGLRLAADGETISGFIAALTGGLVLAGLPRPFAWCMGFSPRWRASSWGYRSPWPAPRIGFAVALLSAGALGLRPFPTRRSAPRRI